MFTLENVRVLTCEEKDWEFNGKVGKFYPTEVRFGMKIFALNSKIDLSEYVDKDVDLECELQSKSSKNGADYVAVRIIGVA